MGKPLDPSGIFLGANDSLIRVLSTEVVVDVNAAAKAALAVSTGNAENDGSSSDTFVTDLDEKVNGKSSAKAMPSNSFA